MAFCAAQAGCHRVSEADWCKQALTSKTGHGLDQPSGECLFGKDHSARAGVLKLSWERCAVARRIG